jgi:hypothetical protein
MQTDLLFKHANTLALVAWKLQQLPFKNGTAAAFTGGIVLLLCLMYALMILAVYWCKKPARLQLL